MSDLLTTLTPEIRDAAAVPRSNGHQVPSTLTAQEPAVERQAEKVTAPAGGAQVAFARQGEGRPNAHGWHVQSDMEIKSYVESLAVRDVPADGLVTLDVRVATVWRVAAEGNLAIEVAEPDLPVNPDPLAPARSFATSLVLILQRPTGARVTWPAGMLWPKGVRDPDGDGDEKDSPLGAVDNPSLAVFVLMRVPTLGWIGFLSGDGFAAYAGGQ